MKLRPEQLGQHLAAPAPALAGAAATYLISGDEPLLVNECLDALRAAARGSGCDERLAHVVDRHFDWDECLASLNSLSLFSSGKLVELRLPNAAPGDEGSRRLRQLAGRAADGNIVVVLTPALKGKVADSAWVGALASGGVWVETRVPSLGDLPQWIERRLRKASLACEPEGLELLAARVEGNLLAAQQEIDKLALLHPAGSSLTAEQVRAAVADGARYDVFQLADAALAGDVPRALRVLAGLKEEGAAAPLVAWSLVREALVLVDAGIRASRDVPPARAVQGAGVWQSRADLYVRALRLHKAGSLRRLLRITGQADRIVKGSAAGEPWNALLELTLALAGRPLRPAELA